jgi:hypothetical protein
MPAVRFDFDQKRTMRMRFLWRVQAKTAGRIDLSQGPGWHDGLKG